MMRAREVFAIQSDHAADSSEPTHGATANYLEVIHTGGKEIYPLVEGKPVFIGRAKECTITLPSSAVSRRHAVVLMKNGICGIKDLGSFNGTLLNDNPLDAPSQLQDGDMVRISSFGIRAVLKLEPNARKDDQSFHEGPGADKAGDFVYAGTNIRIPRAMLAKEAVTKMIGDILPVTETPRQKMEETCIYEPGSDTMVLLRKEMETSQSGRLATVQDVDGITFTDADESPGTDTELPSDEFQDPFPSESDFHEPSREDDTPATDTVQEGDDVLVNPEEAEAIIPLLEPEAMPQLVLEQDETTLALEKLIEDAPTRKWTKHSDEVLVEGPIPVDGIADPLPPGQSAAAGGPGPAIRPETTEVEAIQLQTESASEPEEAVDAIDDTALDHEPVAVVAEGGVVFEETADSTDRPHEPGSFEQKLPEDGSADETQDSDRVGAQPTDDRKNNTRVMDDDDSSGRFSRSTTKITLGVPKDITKVSDRLDSDASDTTRTEKNDGQEDGDASAASAGDAPMPEIGPCDTADYNSVAGPYETDTAVFPIASAVDGVEHIVISPTFHTCIEKRLGLYDALDELEGERRVFRTALVGRDNDAVAILDAQSAELEDLPTSEEADTLLGDLRAKQDDEDEALTNGTKKTASTYTPERRRAEEMAEKQWRLVRDSHRDSLPAVFKEGYMLTAEEPLARELTRVRVSHGRLFGGAMYLLALEALTETTRDEAKTVGNDIRKLSEVGLGGNDSGILRRLGRLGKMAQNLKNRQAIRDDSARLHEREKTLSRRLESLRREAKFIEKFLIREFRNVYLRVAQRYLTSGNDLSLPVRAFLRHGVIGFKSWWMRPEIRDRIVADCQDSVVSALDRGAGDLNILYADEYLSAVARLYCTPSPDESIAHLPKNSDEWKTERAYRRITNARGYNFLLQEMIAGLNERVAQQDRERAALEERLTALQRTPSQRTRDEIFEIQTEIQAAAIRKTNYEKYINRIEKEVVASIIESVQEAEGRFRKGELRMPDAETLIRRECRAIADISRHIAGPKERFIPLAIRNGGLGGEDSWNDRNTIRKLCLEHEDRDPGIFMNVIIGAKKRENRIAFRLTPVVVLVPVSGVRCHCALAREGMEGGHLFLPTLFAKDGLRQRRLIHLFADYRWETSRNYAGRDLIKSDTLVGAFTRIRWEWRNFQKHRREKGLIWSDLSEIANWRRVYEVLIPDTAAGCRNLYVRNQELYEALIGKFIDLPDGVKIIRHR